MRLFSRQHGSCCTCLCVCVCVCSFLWLSPFSATPYRFVHICPIVAKKETYSGSGGAGLGGAALGIWKVFANPAQPDTCHGDPPTASPRPGEIGGRFVGGGSEKPQHKQNINDFHDAGYLHSAPTPFLSVSISAARSRPGGGRPRKHRVRGISFGRGTEDRGRGDYAIRSHLAQGQSRPSSRDAPRSTRTPPRRSSLDPPGLSSRGGWALSRARVCACHTWRVAPATAVRGEVAARGGHGVVVGALRLR